MPFANPNNQPKHDHDHTISQTTIKNATTSLDIGTIGHSINQNNPYRDSSFIGADADAGGIAVTTPHLGYSNNNIRSNSNSIFMPASTSKYPIKQNTIAEDFRERFVNLIAQWIRAFVYLARK